MNLILNKMNNNIKRRNVEEWADKAFNKLCSQLKFNKKILKKGLRGKLDKICYYKSKISAKK